MKYDPWFDTPKNKALLAICARRTVRNIGIGGIVWGAINLVIGIIAIQVTWLNIGLVLLGLLMLGTGLYALYKPTLDALLAEATVSILIFCWNLGIAILNTSAGAPFEPRGLIFPIIAAVIFFNQYNRLSHLKELISSIDPQTVKNAERICKEMQRKKLKDEPDIVETANKKCRIQFLIDEVFCVQRDLQRAFSISRENFLSTIKDLQAKKIKAAVNHPLGKLAYSFNKKNSEKIRAWFSVHPQKTT